MQLHRHACTDMVAMLIVHHHPGVTGTQGAGAQDLRGGSLAMSTRGEVGKMMRTINADQSKKKLNVKEVSDAGDSNALFQRDSCSKQRWVVAHLARFSFCFICFFLFFCFTQILFVSLSCLARYRKYSWLPIPQCPMQIQTKLGNVQSKSKLGNSQSKSKLVGNAQSKCQKYKRHNKSTMALWIIFFATTKDFNNRQYHDFKTQNELDSGPVCGSDDRTYPSSCSLRFGWHWWMVEELSS